MAASRSRDDHAQLPCAIFKGSDAV
eukprot:COSAG01_NODE_30369_length_617_cov_0.835907_1_plen_24_part_10